MYKYNLGLKKSLVNTRRLFAIMWQQWRQRWKSRWRWRQWQRQQLRMVPVELTNTITCSSNSTDSSLLDLQSRCSYTYDFKISLKGFKSPVVVDLAAATRFHQHLIIDLVSIDTCRVRRLQNLSNHTGVTHKSSKSLQNVVRVFLLCLEVLD